MISKINKKYHRSDWGFLFFLYRHIFSSSGVSVVFNLFLIICISKMVFYFQQIYYFKFSLCTSNLCVKSTLGSSKYSPLMPCVRVWRSRAALRWPFLSINCSHQPVFSMWTTEFQYLCSTANVVYNVLCPEERKGFNWEFQGVQYPTRYVSVPPLSTHKWKLSFLLIDVWLFLRLNCTRWIKTEQRRSAHCL